MIEVIKEAIKKQIMTERLTDIFCATVISENPLKVQIRQKLILSSDYLVLSEKVTNHYEEMTLLPKGSDIKDKEDYKNRTKYAVYSGLKKNDRIIVLRATGGQKYYVIDRVGAI